MGLISKYALANPPLPQTKKKLKRIHSLITPISKYIRKCPIFFSRENVADYLRKYRLAMTLIHYAIIIRKHSNVE